MQMGERDRRRFVYMRGFTIVELVIVIVVIAILATISIAAYNGFSNRARAATLISDLTQASKSMKLYQIENSSFPLAIDCSASPAINTICIKPSNGSTFSAYTQNNTLNPQTYCLTVMSGATSYFITHDSVATSGSCTVTNLATNPSMESGLTNIGTAGYGTGGVGSISRTPDGLVGAYAATQTWTTAGSSGGAALYVGMNGGPVLPIEPNSMYTFSAYCKSNISTSMLMYVLERSTSSVQTATPGVMQTVTANEWTRLSTTLVTKPDTATIAFGCRIHNLAGTSNGLFIKMDAAMLATGNTLHTYADGSSPNWIWNGTPGASTSTGPAL